MLLFPKRLSVSLLICFSAVSTAQARVELISKIQPFQNAKITKNTVLKSAPKMQTAQLDTSHGRVYKASSQSNETGFYFSDFIDEYPENPEKATFDCVGGIYAVIKFPASDHDLRNLKMVVEWINPQGDLELTDERAKYAESDGMAYRWGGMILKRPQGGGLFSLLDHSAGMERFIGEWTVNVILGGLRLPSQALRVEC